MLYKTAFFLDFQTAKMMAMAADLKKILSVVESYMPDANLERISQAYNFAEEKHAGQLRFSGEPYFIHPVMATMHLLSLRPDEDTIIACLLHDVIEDTDTDVEVIRKKFGKVVAQLCLDMEKLGTVRYQGQERQIENLRKMFVAMARDLRVIFIKLADRLHNMETLEFVRPDKQQRIAQETLQVYAPIAARLGIFEFKAKLEDLSFKILHPEEYAKLKKELAGSIENQEAFVSKAKKELKNILQKAGIKVEVFGRVKHLYSIWRKMKLKNYPSLEELYDLFALRVITKTTAECYAALGVIHNHYTPLSRRFKDFIAVPKPNGYRSLHTTVIGLSRQSPTEIQIRTQEMHEQAEYGAAAHWQYSAKKQSVKVDEEKLKWVKNLVELHEKMQDNEEFQENLTSDVLEDRIFILTPRGDVFDLPEGATPIDFAYAVHTDVGNTAVGAKVNGKIVKLDEKLHNGEVVEIITRKDAKPNRFWLSFVKTSGAKSKIKAHFGQLDQSENLTLGKDLINTKLTRLGKPKLDADYSILRDYKQRDLGKKEREQLLIRVGNGSVSSSAVVNNLFNLEELVSQKIPRKRLPKAAKEATYRADEVLIEGVGGIATEFAKCCKPKPGDKIFAVMGRKGALIHKENCKQISRSNPERRLQAYFAGDAPQLKLVKIAIDGVNRVGFLRDIAAKVAELGINIVDVNYLKVDKHQAKREFTLEIENIAQLTGILTELEKVDGVKDVRKI